MLPLREVTDVIENRLAAGERSVDAIADAVYAAFRADIDPEDAIRIAVKKRVSLAISHITDADGERATYPSKDAEGRRVVVDLRRRNDPAAVLEAAKRYELRIEKDTHKRDTLYAHYYQLTLNLEAAA